MGTWTADSNSINQFSPAPPSSADAGLAITQNFARISSLISAANTAVANLQAAIAAYGNIVTHNASDFLQTANNLSDLTSASSARTYLGLGSAATSNTSAFDASGAASAAQTASLQKSSNLSDLTSTSIARSNLGLGSAATTASSAYDAAGAAATVNTALTTHEAATTVHGATSANTAGRIVSRDGSGNFLAGTITASLLGHASLDLPLTGGIMAGTLDLNGQTLNNAHQINFTTNGLTLYDGYGNVAANWQGGNPSPLGLNNIAQLTFTDSSVQTTAFTGGGTSNLSAVLTVGNDAGNQQIINLSTLEITSGGYIAPNMDGGTLNIGGSSGMVINFAGSPNVNMNNGAGSGGGIFNMDGGIITGISASQFGTVQVDSAGITFADTTRQTTAYTGMGGGTPNLSSVLTSGNDAGGQSIVNIGGGIVLNSGSPTGGAVTFGDGTVQSTAYTGGGSTPSLSSVLSAGNDAGLGNITNAGSITFGGGGTSEINLVNGIINFDGLATLANTGELGNIGFSNVSNFFMNGNAGFSGSGSYTNFTIVNGFITNAS